MDVVIVTGAAGGIGSVYVKALAKAGYGVVAADLQPPEQLVAQIKAGGGTALAVAVDVSERASTEAMAAKTEEAFGRIDCLVNNAAYYSAIVKKDFTELTDRGMGPLLRCQCAGRVAVRPRRRFGHEAGRAAVRSSTSRR